MALTEQCKNRLFFLAFVAAGTSATLLFVYLFPVFFDTIQLAWPGNYEAAVTKAIEVGDAGRALRIARHAVRKRPPDPKSLTLYGRLLLAHGQTEVGLDQLRAATEVQRESDPPRQETRKPFYYAGARLSLGSAFLDQGRSRGAVTQFELARGYSDLHHPAYVSFHEKLFQAYHAEALWGRALEFGSSHELTTEGLSPDDLAYIVAVAAGKGDWKMVRRAAETLLESGHGTATAHFYAGRALSIADEPSGVAHLRQAAVQGHSDASFFLGNVLVRAGQTAAAIQAFRQTPAESLYRPFALARAWELTEASKDRTELHAMLTAELEAIEGRYLPVDLSEAPYALNRPIAVNASRLHDAPGARAPVVVLWQTTPDDKAPVIHMKDTENPTISLRMNDRTLLLEWVENLVYWEGVERLAPGTGDIPGWTDTARDWFGLRDQTVAAIGNPAGGGNFLMLHALSWYYSVPRRLGHAQGYLLTGRLKGPPPRAWLRCQYLDEGENVLYEQVVTPSGDRDDWQACAGYVRSLFHWKAARAQLGILPGADYAAFDDVALIPLVGPAH